MVTSLVLLILNFTVKAHILFSSFDKMLYSNDQAYRPLSNSFIKLSPKLLCERKHFQMN